MSQRIIRGSGGYVLPLFPMLVLFCLIGIGPAWATTYYVSPTGNDSNVGSEASPWRTLGKAATTMVGGDTTIVEDGTYVEGNINFGTSGTEGNPITLRARHKHLAILSSTSGCLAKISTNASYIIIEDIRTQTDPANVACGSHNSTDGTGVRAFSGNAPHLGGTETTTYHDVVVRGTWHDDCGGECSHSIKLDGDRSRAEDNYGANGMESGFGEGIIFRGNVIDTPDGFGNGFGCTKFGSRNAQCYGNLVRCGTNWAACLFQGGTSGEGLHWDTANRFEGYNAVAYNNVFLQTGSPANPMDIAQFGCKDCLTAHNTIVGNKFRFRFLQGGGSSGQKYPENPGIKNNVLVSTGECFADIANYTGTLAIDYNNFRTCTSPPSQTHAISGDPSLDANYVPQAGSPLIDAAETITTWPKYGGGTIALDLSYHPPWFAGTFSARPYGASNDVGAWEYRGVIRESFLTSAAGPASDPY